MRPWSPWQEDGGLCRGSGKPTLWPPDNSPPFAEALSRPGRSTEEIIALFISITFMLDAVKGMVKSECLAGGYLLQGELS